MEKLFEYEKQYYTSVEYQNYCNWEYKSEKKDKSPFEELVVLTPLHPFDLEWKAIQTKNTKECFEENILNPLWNVSSSKYIIVIEKNDEKVRIKFYYRHLTRAAGQKYYKISTVFRFFSYNFKTNAFYEGTINNYHKKRKFSKKMRRVSPNANSLSSVRSHIYNIIGNEKYQDKEGIFCEEKTHKIYEIFLNAIPGLENYKDIPLPKNRFYKMYYDKQGVKLPDNWLNLIFTFPQPKLRTIRKYKMKYIDALMSVYKLKGDKIRKVLHNVSNLNVTNLQVAFGMFGETTILQQSDNFIKKLIESTMYIPSANLVLPPKEKKNAFEIFKLVVEEQINAHTFLDHYNFYNNVNRFEKIKWKSKDVVSFREEHLDWTERNDFYTKGDYERIYDKNFIEFSQEPIFDAQDNVYYPILLQSSKEYNEESFTQSNCVKTYVQKPSSIIISLRKGSKDSKERATIEFSILMIKDKIYLNRIQTLGRFNGKLDETWHVPLAILDSRIRNSYSQNEYELPKIEVKFGHKTIVSNGVFKNDRPFIYLIRKNEDEKTDTYYLAWDRSLDVNETSEMYYNQLIPPPLEININENIIDII